MKKILFLLFVLILLRNISYSQGHGDRLLWCADKGNLECVKSQLAKGIDVNYVADSDYTALMYATQRCHIKIVKFLLLKGADVNYRSKSDKKTPLIITLETPLANKKDKNDIVKMLLKHGVDLSLKNSNNKSALDLAKSNNLWEIVNLIRPDKKNINKISYKRIRDILTDQEDATGKVAKLKIKFKEVGENQKLIFEEVVRGFKFPKTLGIYFKKHQRKIVKRLVENRIYYVTFRIIGYSNIFSYSDIHGNLIKIKIK